MKDQIRRIEDTHTREAQLWANTEKNSVQKQIGNQTQKIRRFNGELGYAQYAGERERERQDTKLYSKTIIVLCETLYIVCVQ